MYQDGGATCDKTNGLKITLSRTPANIGQACGLQTPVVWVRPKGCAVDTEWAAVIVKTGEDGNLNGKVLTIPDTLANYGELLKAADDAHGVCVEYFVDKPEARSVGINANFIPAELVLLLTTNLFAGDANAPETGKPVGSITVKIPRFQLDGQFDLSMAMTSAATMSLNGTALAVDNGECDGNGIYAEIVEVEQNSTVLSGLKEILIDKKNNLENYYDVYGKYKDGHISIIGDDYLTIYGDGTYEFLTVAQNDGFHYFYSAYSGAGEGCIDGPYPFVETKNAYTLYDGHGVEIKSLTFGKDFYAELIKTEGELSYKKDEDEDAYYVNGTGTVEGPLIIIPSTYNELPVKGIAGGAFANQSGLSTVVFGENITSIGDSAFSGCTSLKSITIPDSVTSIGEGAFYNCSGLTSATIGDGVTSIGNNAFSGCSSLKSITIPFVGAQAGVTSTDTYQYPFGYIFGTSEYTGGTATEQHYYESSTSSTTSTTYYIPSSLRTVMVTGGNILYGAFYNCENLTSINIPDGITSMGAYAFYGCGSLISINIPDSVTSIGDYTFYHCYGLNNMIIPNGVESIGERVFCNCTHLQTIKIPKTITSIGPFGISYCTVLTSVVFEDGIQLQTIEESAFRGNPALFDFIIPDSVTEIKDYGVAYCGLINIMIPKNVSNIATHAFYYCSALESINVSQNNAVYYSDNNCLIKTDTDTNTKTLILGCKNSVIPSDGSITSIGAYAFGGCSRLTSITIPDSVESIGEGVFVYCSGLTSIVVSEGNNVYHSENNCLIETDAYTLVAGCKNSVIPSDGSVTSIGAYAFEGCSGLTSVVIPDSVTSIGVYAFEGCSGLTSVVIPDSVTSMGNSAFRGCSGLTSITIPDNVTSIGNSVFRDCSVLTSVVIPVGVTNIGNYAFDNCSGLTSIYYKGNSSEWDNISIGSHNENLTSADRYYYSEEYPAEFEADKYWHYVDGVPTVWEYYTQGLTYSLNFAGDEYSVTGIGTATDTDIVIPDVYDGLPVTRIDGDAFQSCVSLTSVTIPNSIIDIGDGAFDDCRGLTSVTIGNSVEGIGTGSFYNCDNLTSVTIPDSVTDIGESAFGNDSSLEKIIVQGNTPPTITSSTFNNTNNCPIYVPDESVSTYQNAWDEYADRIRSISELPIN